MRAFICTVLAVAALVLSGCGSVSSSPTLSPTASAIPSGQITVPVNDATGSVVATVTLTPLSSYSAAPTASFTSPSVSPFSTATGVHVHVVVNYLAPGGHGFQIHAKGICEPPTFASSGPIFNPTPAAHGFNNPRGPKAGDLPDLGVGTDHTATFDFTDTLVSLDSGATNSLTGESGTSLIITRDPDDQLTQPEGNAGPRIACGVISPGTAVSPSATPSAGVTSHASTPTPLSTPTAKPTGPTATPTP